MVLVIFATEKYSLFSVAFSVANKMYVHDYYRLKVWGQYFIFL